jgi:glycosyltransferase involved in cell wall biosynthesis
MRKFLFGKVSAFATFSEYSRLLFEKVYHPKVLVADLRLVPYFCYKALGSKKIPEFTKRPNEKVFLFFGRLSSYKGIDELLNAFSKVLQKFPEIKLVIAGKGNYSYVVPEVLANSSSLIAINRFVADFEIKSLFEQADVLVCPYRDATQSGVLMTAAAFQIPVIVSNVGALSEYITDGGKGYVYELNDEVGLENCLMQFLNDSQFSDMLVEVADDTAVYRNSQLLVDLYTQLLVRK